MSCFHSIGVMEQHNRWIFGFLRVNRKQLPFLVRSGIHNNKPQHRCVVQQQPDRKKAIEPTSIETILHIILPPYMELFLT